MLSQEENQLLTRVGPGTPMGELFRRFWLPALLSDELPGPDSPPVRLRILCEDLVAFRDTNGEVGILNAYCPHRLAQLFFGRNEECGLRCVYHGWKFDVHGACVDMPNEPEAYGFQSKISVKAYPTQEWGGLVWVYMGPADKRPQLPQFEWARVPASHRQVSRWVQETSYLQGMEGEIDTSHSMFLHSWFDPNAGPARSRRWQVFKNKSPRLAVKETDYGFIYGGRYETLDNEYYWRCTQWLLPMFSLTPNQQWPRGGRAWVPIDDETTCTFAYTYHHERPLTEDELTFLNSGQSFPPQRTRCAYQLKDGYIIDTWRTVRNRENDYLIDREDQRTSSFTGLYGINDQDRAMQESMGRICDRTAERLGTSDVAIIAARRLLIRLARELEQGVEPKAPHLGDAYRVRSLDTISREGDFHRLLAENAAETSGQV